MEVYTLKELPLTSYAWPIDYSIDPVTGCWNVISHVPNSTGYVQVRRNDQQILAHRYSWELTYGLVPEGLFVCHHCDNPICINPEHLFLGTSADNRQDAMQKERLPCGENHGRHKLTEADVRAIRADRISSQRALAREYGVSHSNICAIKTGATWGWLEC